MHFKTSTTHDTRVATIGWTHNLSQHQVSTGQDQFLSTLLPYVQTTLVSRLRQRLVGKKIGTHILTADFKTIQEKLVLAYANNILGKFY